MTENCSCGAAIKTWRIKWWLFWREQHQCKTVVESVVSVTEVDPIGFTPNEVE